MFDWSVRATSRSHSIRSSFVRSSVGNFLIDLCCSFPLIHNCVRLNFSFWRTTFVQCWVINCKNPNKLEIPLICRYLLSLQCRLCTLIDLSLEKKWGKTSYRIYTLDHETKLRLNGRYFTSTVLLIVHQSHRKFNNVRPLITLSLLFMTHETIIRFSLYLIAIKLLASAFFPQTSRLLFELAIFAIDFSGFSKEFTETVVSIWLFFISACVVLIMYEIFFHLFFTFFDNISANGQFFLLICLSIIAIYPWIGAKIKEKVQKTTWITFSLKMLR